MLAVVFGGAALLFGLIPFAGLFIGGLFAVAAIVLGIIGILKSHKVMAIIGISLAALGMIISGAITGATFDAADYEDAPSRTLAPTTESEPTAEPTTSAEPTEEPTTSAEPTEEPTTSPEPQEDPGAASDRVFGDGKWTVGEDIEPGTYSTTVPDDSYGCYWERLSGFSGELDDIIANGITEPGLQTTVTIESSDEGFTSQDCGTWELQD
ncbi:IgG-binding virulence factor TspB family protein [Glycomyces sp. YM15]|uniref:IgG-binding virulence factor TspB family protein n=1 Tax=Glycomyces sp. YM15 TaxID=2800446 RepID=UPI001966C600|nr:IgG-binding virulence factor TspB family protein [Glycomyces sp. YM15]